MLVALDQDLIPNGLSIDISLHIARTHGTTEPFLEPIVEHHQRAAATILAYDALIGRVWLLLVVYLEALVQQIAVSVLSRTLYPYPVIVLDLYLLLTPRILFPAIGIEVALLVSKAVILEIAHLVYAADMP